jgi:hypothetical protein
VLKFRHLRVKIRALRPAVIRRREPAQIPLLPLAEDLVNFLAKMEVQESAEIKMIGRSKSRSRSRSRSRSKSKSRKRSKRRRRRASKMMKRGRRISDLPLHEANLGLLRIQKRNPRRGWLPSR